MYIRYYVKIPISAQILKDSKEITKTYIVLE